MPDLKVASFALGCKVNQYESRAVGNLFKEKGYILTDIDSSADIYVINTCTVTNLGDKKSRQLIRKCRRLNPDARGVYTWWSYRFNARKNNAGWRIDYFLVSERFMPKVKDQIIRSDIFGSDHCPVELICE